MSDRRPFRLLRRWRNAAVVVLTAAVLAIGLFVPFQTCPACKGSGAFRGFPGQCEGRGCGGKGRLSLWDLAFPPPVRLSK